MDKESLGWGLDFLSRYAMRPWGEHAHGGHDDKNTVCLACFNRRLAKAGWTYVPGERPIKVERYVMQGRFTTRKVAR